VAYLISWGCELNLREIESGHTPLHLGVLARSRRVVRLLLLKGADMHIKVRFIGEFLRKK